MTDAPQRPERTIVINLLMAAESWCYRDEETRIYMDHLEARIEKLEAERLWLAREISPFAYLLSEGVLNHLAAAGNDNTDTGKTEPIFSLPKFPTIRKGDG